MAILHESIPDGHQGGIEMHACTNANQDLDL